MTERTIPHIKDIFDDLPDSAMGTSCEEEPPTPPHQEDTRKKKTKGGKKGEQDLKHLERHLSMKKTIRKKMMRDLQQALVADPDEVKEGDVVNSLTFTGKQKKRQEGFLDFLRNGGSGGTYNKGDADERDRDSGRDSPTKDDSNNTGSSGGQQDDKKGFWRRFTMRRNKR